MSAWFSLRIQRLHGGTCLAALLVGLLTLLVAPISLTAQNLDAHNLDAFEMLALPDADSYRTGDGRPGPAYWQQEADYDIAVELLPEENRIEGTQTITYTNHAPSELGYLWLQMDQNLFAPGSRGEAVVPQDARFSGFFAEGGYDIANLRVEHDGTTYAPDYVIDDTRMRVDLGAPLAAAGDSLALTIDFSFELPDYGADRMGMFDAEEGTVYQLAQWYPRMYVYDDVNGWNVLPYLGQGEYYLEYGQFTLDITVPHDFIVTATGALQNPEEVLTDTQQERLSDAQQSRTPVHIIAADEVGAADTRPTNSGTLTWQFVANDVRDVAWAASRSFIWDAAQANAGPHTVLAQSLYPAEGLGGENSAPGWEESTKYVQHAVEFYSERFAPYPYDYATNVGGIVAGMEYPQIMFCSVEARGRSLFGVTDHEFGHTWFPMLVGSDERRWAWMDEGLNTFMNLYSTADFYDQDIEVTFQQASRQVVQFTQSGYADQSIMTQSDHIRRRALGMLAYRKPAAGLMLLREHVVGPARFDAAFKAYVDRWAYKHPQPSDFFRTIESVAGEELDWFWRGWFYGTDGADPALDSVTPDQAQAAIVQNTDLILPLSVELTFDDGSIEIRRIPAEAFVTSDTHTLAWEAGRTVSQITIDPRQILPDLDRDNNTWERSETND
ncbi:MAG: M1 family peptidase [Bacteroidetes bacterium]|nr:M1 family peptidase [Bacteroidota bacterium]